MKQALLILGVFCLQQVVFGAVTEADMPPEQIECLKQLNVAASVILENFNEDWTISEGNSDVNDVWLCTFEKFHRLNEVEIKKKLVDELFKQANMTFDNPEEIGTNSIESCKDVRGNGIPDSSVKIWNCIFKYLRIHENKV